MAISTKAKEFISGEKLYHRRARNVLPILVRQAQAKQPIYYSDLAKEVSIPNPRNLDYVLGSIGNALIAISKEMKILIPPIQSLVINKKTGIPGKGIEGFIKNVNEYSKLNYQQKGKIINDIFREIFLFDRWDEVLRNLDLTPIAPQKEINVLLKKAGKCNNGGESTLHKRFKEYISNNPYVLGLIHSSLKSIVEYTFSSADSMDVSFKNKSCWIGVEVKSRISDKADILRGLFQCVKYKALMEAESSVQKTNYKDIRVILALEAELPTELIGMKNTLGIEVIDNINIYKID